MEKKLKLILVRVLCAASMLTLVVCGDDSESPTTGQFTSTNQTQTSTPASGDLFCIACGSKTK